MPWETIEEAKVHNKNLSDKQAKVWLQVANSILAKCLEDGGEQKTCETKAIIQANGVAKKATTQDEVETIEFDESGNVIVSFIQKETYSADMEVFATGKWNGDDYSEKDLDQMVEAFGDLKDKWRPFLKLGHGDNKHNFDQPALGYADSLKRVGQKLVATFVNIPKVVKEAIDKGLYKKRSAEVYWDYQTEGKKYPRVLKACALLGASVPAITVLADIPKFFEADGGEIEARIYDMPLDAKSYGDCSWSENRTTITARIRYGDELKPESMATEQLQDGIILTCGQLREDLVPKDDEANKLYPVQWQFDRTKWTLSQAQDWLGFDPSRRYEELKNYKGAVIKTEDGIEYPKEAFLFVPDLEKPSTWKLRVWENLEDKVTKAQLGRAAAAFSSGGFRGNKVELPEGETERVKKKLRELYTSIGVAKEDMPSHLFNYKDTNRRFNTMDYEALLKEKEDKIQILQEKLVKYQADKDSEKIVELTEAIEAQQEEITQLKKFEQENKDLRAKVADAEKELTESAAREKRRDVEIFLHQYGAKGEKKILPRDEKLVEAILINCPEEKSFAAEGEKEAMTLAGMVKEYITRQTAKVDTTEHSSQDKDKEEKQFVSVAQEVDTKTKEYMVANKINVYSEALRAVLNADPDLKLRYTGAKA